MSNIKTDYNQVGLLAKAIMILMILCSMDFIRLNYYWIFIAFLLLIVIYHGKLYVDANLGVLLLFSFSMLIFNSTYQQSITNMLKPFVFPIAYCIGYNVVFVPSSSNSKLDISERNVERAVFLVSIGSMTHFALNAYINNSANSRNVIDFWSRSASSATGQAALASIMIGVVVAFLLSNSNKKKKVVALVSLALIVIYNLVLAGRTIFVVLLIVFAFAFIYKAINEKKKIFKLTLIVIALCVAVFFLYENDVLGIKTTVELSNFYDRFVSGDITTELNEDSRFEHKLEYAKHMLGYPFGGGNIRALLNFSAHDLYLDTYDESGVFAFLFIVIYIVSSIARIVRCMRNKNISFQVRMLLACVYLSINIIFWLEPIIRGMHWLLTSYCFVDGAVTRMLKKECGEKLLVK